MVLAPCSIIAVLFSTEFPILILDTLLKSMSDHLGATTSLILKPVPSTNINNAHFYDFVYKNVHTNYNLALRRLKEMARGI
ncbi:hypothetical protein B5S50_08365 [Clostridium sp. 001]|nr:hypothetical protein B5S50_08365 [Clostridium sp. 001]